MKKFLIRLSCFSLILLSAVSAIILIQSLVLDDEILDNDVESKISKLVIDTNKINIIIAGDSRAERHLSPAIIKENTGFNTINIATSACDLFTVATAIRKKYPFGSKNIFIISASSWQINDGAIDPGYLSLKCFQKLTLLEKIMLYKRNLMEMIRLQKQLTKIIFYKLLQKEDNLNYDENIIKELGFNAIKGNLNSQLKVNNLEKIYVSHPWYKNINNNGVRWSIFQKALSEFGNMDSLFIIYQPPISPYWRVNTATIDLAEIEYSKKLGIEIQKYNNILFFDFYNNPIISLTDNMYYDTHHLNRQGAEVFSVFLSKKILEVYQTNFKENDGRHDWGRTKPQ